MTGTPTWPAVWGPLARSGQGLFDNPVLVDIPRAHHRTVAQIALRRLIQPEIAAIPKSVRPNAWRRTSTSSASG
jgi:diketogulonate reductase-like aldo/keto reductase